MNHYVNPFMLGKLYQVLPIDHWNIKIVNLLFRIKNHGRYSCYPICHL